MPSFWWICLWKMRGILIVMKLLLLIARKVWRGYWGSKSNTASEKQINAPTHLLEGALLVRMILLFFNFLQLMWPCWLVLMQLEHCISVSAFLYLLLSFVWCLIPNYQKSIKYEMSELYTSDLVYDWRPEKKRKTLVEYTSVALAKDPLIVKGGPILFGP